MKQEGADDKSKKAGVRPVIGACSLCTAAHGHGQLTKLFSSCVCLIHEGCLVRSVEAHVEAACVITSSTVRGRRV